ncbi:MAG: GNAT family N-acetyltransferase [candidate division Zixibacteria bacterium]|nr:GNAT family N-acetyltransferase [candidate division Zixibacteria bacterium]
MPNIRIKPLTDKHRQWSNELLTEAWGSTEAVSSGWLHHTDKLPGFVTLLNDKPVALVTYNIDGDQCEIVTLNSLEEKQGIGSALVNTVRNEAYSKGCVRLWLITTNDNTYAFSFYQRLGFKVAGYHINAIEKSRELKPSIPYIGMNGIVIRDEIEFEMMIEA